MSLLSDEEVFGSSGLLSDEDVFGPAPAAPRASQADVRRAEPVEPPRRRGALPRVRAEAIGYSNEPPLLERPQADPFADPMLNRQFVEDFRANVVGALAPEDRMPFLRAVSEKTDIQGRAAKELLARAEAEARVWRPEDLRRQAERVPQPGPTPAGGGAPPRGRVEIPDPTPNFTEMAQGVAPAEVARRRAAEMGALRQQAEGRMFDGTSGRERNTRTVARDALLTFEEGVTNAKALIANSIDPSSEWARSLRQEAQALQQRMSPEERASRDIFQNQIDDAQKEGELRALAATVVLTLTDPMAATREALRQAPIIAGMVGMTAAGAGLGAGAFALAGAARPALQVANAIRGGALAAGATQAGGLAGGAIAGGMAAGGDAAGSTYEHLMDKAKVSDELLLQSPDAKALMAEGKSLDEARAIIAKQRARIAQSIATPLGMALGPLGLEAVIARRAAGRAAGSRSAAFGLELGGEVGDEVATQVAGNIGVRGVDASVPLMQGTGQAAGSALATALPTATIAAAAARPMTQPPAQPQGPTAAEAAAARGFGPRAPLPPRVEDMPTRPLTPEELQAVAPAPATQNAGTTPAAPQAASPAPGRTADGAPGAAPRAATQEPAPSAAVRPSAIGVGRVRQGALAQAAGRALGVTDVDQPDLADLAAAPAGAAAGRRDLPGGSGGTVGPDAPSARGVGGDSAAPAAGGAADSALAAAGGPGSALSAQRAKAGASRVDLANLVAAATRPNAQGNRAYAVYRAVDDGEAQTLSQLVGVDLRGFAHGIDESAVRHILNRHGTEKAAVEADRNQVPVTAADLELLPRLTDPRAADRVTPSFNASNGLRAIEYTTRVNGHYFVVEEVRTGRNRLSVVSMRKVRAAPAASAGAPAAVPLTSETFGARPTGTVAQDAPRLQNRDRRDAAYVRQMQAIAAQPDPLRLSFSRDLASGAPVVLADGAQPTLFGNESVVTTAEGRRIPVRYAVVDAEALLPSNRADGTANEGYQGGAAGRLRVVAGNGRAAGLQLAYRLGTTTRYKQGIAEDAALHGVSAERIARMSEPVLVRVMSPADVTANIGDESNVSGVADKSAREMAQDDARRLDLSALEFDDDGNVTPQALAQFVNAMPLSEQTGMRNADGTATRQAQDRLLAATFWAAYEDDALLALAAQAIDPEARVVMAALAQAAAPMMRLRDAGELDIRPIVSQAAQLAVAARRRGMNAQQAAQQLDLAADPAVAVVLGLFARNSRSARRIGQALRDAAQFAYDEATKPGDDMFGAVPRATRADVLRRLDDDTRGQEGLEVGGGREPAGRDAGRAQGTDARGTAGAGRAEGAERAAGQGGTEGGAGAAVQGAGAADRLTDAQAFVPAPGGGIDFGEITPEMGQAMRRQAAPIRLQQGVQNADGTGYGLAHIEANHGAQIRSAGFEDVPAFIAHVARNFNEVLQATKGRQLLVAVTTGRRDVMFVQLEPAGNGDFYRVNSAFPASRDYLEKQEIKGAKVLWSGSEPRSAAAGRQPPYAGATETRPDDGAPIAESQGAESVSPPRTFRAAGPDPLLGAANVDDAARVFPSRGAALAAAAQAGLVGRVEVQPVDGGFALAPRIEDASASVAGEDASETRRLNAQFASAGWRNADGTPARATLVPDASASRPFRQLQAAVAAVFGIRVLDVRGIDANGVQFGRRAFVNTGYADTPGLLIGITGHEALHWLETNDKPAAQRLHATIGQYLRDGAVQRQLEFENRNLLPGEQPVSAERAHSEVLANLNGAMWLDPAFWQRVAELDNGSTLRRVVYAFLRRAAQVARVIRGSELDALRYVQDVAAVREAVAQVWAGRGAGQPRQQATAAGARGAVMSRGARDGGNIEVQRLDSPLPDGRQWVAIFSEGGNERITFHASEADARAAGQAVLGADAGREGGGGPTAGTRQAPAEGANADGSAPRVRNASYRLADGRQPGLGLTDRASALLGRREAEAITSKREVDRRVEQGVLTQLPERRRFCFQYAAATAINGVGDMVIGVSQDAMGDRVWHAVVMRDGYTYDPTMRQWFAPGVYEATGFSPRLSLSPQQVMEYLRAHDGMAPDALNQGLGAEPSLSRRDSGTRGTASLFDDDGPLFSQAGAAPDPVEPLLTAQTPDDLRQRAERQARATEEARRRSAQRDARLRQEADERENRARADATRADFQLGQSAEQQMAGQEDLFAAPLRGAMLSRRARPAPEASFAATERAYGGRAAYDRARADGRTRLTYGQWVQVRTPEFKRWFGAWDAAANAEMDRDAATVEQARAAATQFVGQPLENLATGMQAAVSRNTLGKMTSASAQQKSTSAADHALAVANADKLFTHAMLDRSHSDARGEPTIAAIHRYVAPMRTSAGRLVAVKMTVKETTGPSEPNPLYSIETLEIENPPSVLSRANPDGTGIRPQAGFSDSVQVLLAAVNGEGVSKVVDRDTGEPQVVYHGSADFRPEAVPLGEAVFDPTRGGGEGSFFTPYRERALRYSNGRDDGITAAFLSIKRPDSWIGDRERLIREGYDGARDGSTGAWAAFYPEQIKSATGNRGTFDPGEADIRLSRRARPDAERNDIRAAALLQGPPVAVLRGDEAPQDGGMAALRDWATGLYAALPTPNMALHPDLGSVMLDERSVPSSSSHGMTRHKAAAFAAVPAVIERGALVAHGVDGNVDSYFVSAPVDIAGRADVVTVLIKRDPKVQRMYLHSVATKEFLLRPLDSRADAGEASGRTGKLTAGEVASVLRRLLEVDLAAAGGSVGDDIRLSRRAQQPARAPTAAELSKAADDMAQDGYNRLAGRFVTLRDPDGSARQAPAAQALREIDRRADLARRILDCLA